jgi:Fe-S cluster assembly iron-binding protein IscA
MRALLGVASPALARMRCREPNRFGATLLVSSALTKFVEMSMTGRRLHSGFDVTRAARSAITMAIGRHCHPVVVRIGIVPGIPPMARMYLATPRPEDEVAEFGPARLVVDPGSRWYLEGATVDYSLGLFRGHFSISGPRLELLPQPSAATVWMNRPFRSSRSQQTSRSSD